MMKYDAKLQNKSKRVCDMIKIIKCERHHDQNLWGWLKMTNFVK